MDECLTTIGINPKLGADKIIIEIDRLTIYIETNIHNSRIYTLLHLYLITLNLKKCFLHGIAEIDILECEIRTSVRFTYRQEDLKNDLNILLEMIKPLV